MGKVFVKSPVESPNDLLAKQTAAVAPSMSQRIRRRGADFGRALGNELKELGSVAGPAVGNYLATRPVAEPFQRTLAAIDVHKPLDSIFHCLVKGHWFPT